MDVSFGTQTAKCCESGKEQRMIEKVAWWFILGGFVAMMNGFMLLFVAHAIDELL